MSLSVLMSLTISSNSDTAFSETDLLRNSLSSSALWLRSWKVKGEINKNNGCRLCIHHSVTCTHVHVNVMLYPSSRCTCINKGISLFPVVALTRSFRVYGLTNLSPHLYFIILLHNCKYMYMHMHITMMMMYDIIKSVCVCRYTYILQLLVE